MTSARSAFNSFLCSSNSLLSCCSRTTSSEDSSDCNIYFHRDYLKHSLTFFFVFFFPFFSASSLLFSASSIFFSTSEMCSRRDTFSYWSFWRMVSQLFGCRKIFIDEEKWCIHELPPSTARFAPRSARFHCKFKYVLMFRDNEEQWGQRTVTNRCSLSASVSIWLLSRSITEAASRSRSRTN